MLFFRRVMFLLGLSILIPAVMAEPAREESIREFLKYQSTSEIEAQMGPLTEAMLYEAWKETGLLDNPPSEAQRREVSKAVQEVKEVWLRYFGEQQMLLTMLQYYPNLYTEEEMQEMLRLYRTPIGKVIASKSKTLIFLLWKDAVIRQTAVTSESKPIYEKLAERLRSLNRPH